MQRAILVFGAIASGALMAAAFPPVSWSPLVIVGVALLIAVARCTSCAAAFGLGLVSGMSGLTIAVSWLWPTIFSFAGVSSTVGSVFGIVFLVYHALQLALFASVVAWWPGKDGVGWGCAGLAAVWVLLEWSFPRLAPWSLGDALADSALLRQGADIGGVHGLSFLVVVAATALARSAAGGDLGQARLRALGIGGLAVVSMVAYGQVRLSSGWGTAKRTLRVAAIQGGLGVDVDPRQQNERAWEIYEALTRVAGSGQNGSGTSLIVWPETTLRAYLRHDRHEVFRLRRLADSTGASLLLGALDLPQSGGGELNAAFLISPRKDGRQLQVYHKAALVPFGEYVPGARWLSVLSRWKTTGGYVPGNYSGPLKMSDGIKLGPSICFEAMQPGAANRMVSDGAMVLVNLSDDGRFAGAAARWQHLGGAVMRAVETRRWLVRVSDSGISAVIDPAGRIVDMLDSGAVGALQATVPLRESLSLYVRFGDWVAAMCVLILAGRVSSSALGAAVQRK